MTHPNSSITEQLNTAEQAIRNSLADAEIQQCVAGCGYSIEKLGEGRLLFEVARATVRARERAAEAQLSAGYVLDATRREAFEAYQALARIARAILHPAALSRLGLQGEMPRGVSAFLTAAATLFDHAPAMHALADFGYDAAGLAAERAKVEAFKRANQQHETASGVARQAFAEQDEALAALEKWMAQYQESARGALSEQPQLLEKIGVAGRLEEMA